MRYLLLICFDESAAANAQPELTADSHAWVKTMKAQGIHSVGGPLGPATDARSVRVRDGQVLLEDGPFTETSEPIGGFDLIECADLDEALAVAAQHPVAKMGTVEVRPLGEE
ncbi:YciI family protein [Kribbella sp. CWNU-51]